MKNLIVFVFLTFLIASCNTEPEIIDTGEPGQIKVIVFQDQNHNQVMDHGEAGLRDEVGISQDISCPAGNLDEVTRAITDSNGEAVFENLKPGKYCVMYMGPKPVTSKLTLDVYLSSDQEIVVGFGLTD